MFSLLWEDTWIRQDNVGVRGMWYSLEVSPSLITSVISLECLWNAWNVTVFGQLHFPEEGHGSRCASLYCSCMKASQKDWKEWSQRRNSPKCELIGSVVPFEAWINLCLSIKSFTGFLLSWKKLVTDLSSLLSTYQISNSLQLGVCLWTQKGFFFGMTY